MNCIKCGGKIRVVDLVHTNDNETYRRKRCKTCGNEFFTIEFEAEADEKFIMEWGVCHRNEYMKKRDASEYKPKNFIPGTIRKYERYTEDDRQYMMDHCYETPEVVAKHLGKNVKTVSVHMYKYRKERRTNENGNS